MKRSIPRPPDDAIALYMRTIYSLLRTTSEVQIRTLEETHIAMRSSLHPHAGGIEPDMSAFTYASLRLPPCISQVKKVILGQSEEVFRRRGYPEVESWRRVVAPARRRRMLFDEREGILAAYIASISDVDDIVPTLTAFQIEWNKMHRLLSRKEGMLEMLQIWAANGEVSIEVEEEVREALHLSPDDWQRMHHIWKERLPSLLLQMARQRKRMSVTLLAGSHIDYRRATQRWWNRVNEMAPFDLRERPLYFVSSNTHSLVNMLSGFAQAHEDRLLDYLEHQAPPQLKEEYRRIQRGDAPSDRNNFLYYVLKKYLQTEAGRDLLEARSRWEAEHGITRIPSQHTFDLEVQLIELKRLRRETIDPRLRDLPLEALTHSEAIILNIDYPLGFAAYHLLTRLAVNVGQLLGAYIIGKAATLNARIGDVLIPNVVYDEHSRNTYLFGNVFTAAHVRPHLVYGDVLDNQRALTVRGTFLQNDEYMRGFLERGYTDVEMEAGPYLSALYEFIRPRRYPTNELVNLYPVPFEIGILHYASDTPMSKGRNLGSRNLSYYGMDPTYAATVAVLRRIIGVETGAVSSPREPLIGEGMNNGDHEAAAPQAQP